MVYAMVLLEIRTTRTTTSAGKGKMLENNVGRNADTKAEIVLDSVVVAHAADTV